MRPLPLPASVPGVGAALALAACQPDAWTDPAVCDADRPPPGEVRVAPVSCDGQRVPGGEGRGADVWMANAWLRVVLRHPQDAATLAGVGGGTVVDASTWDGEDVLHEVAPIVGGGGLAVEDWALEPDGLRLSGVVVSLPDRPADTPGAPRTVRWTLDPDGPWLRLEGADGLWIHARGDAEVLDGQVRVGAVVVGHDGVVAEDLGGALRVDGAGRLLVAPATEAWGLLAEEPVRLSGVAPGATELWLLRDGERVGWLPLTDGRFDARIGAAVTAVQAHASGRAPSPPTPPGEGLSLALGGAGAVRVEPLGAPRPFRVEWTADDGRSGEVELPADGGELALGAGGFDLRASAGPSRLPALARVEVASGTVVTWRARLEPAFDVGAYVQVALGAPSDVDRTFRGSDAAAVRRLAAEGFDHVVFTPADEVATVEAEDARDLLTWRNGARLTDRAGAWNIWSWSWSANPKNNAHGVHDVAGLAPEDALAVAWGGPSRDRFTAVDTGFLRAVGMPWQLDPRPDLVRLDHPLVDPEGWDRWFRWLDARAALLPIGPVTWVPVEDPSAVSAVDVERGLIRGRASAGTGPLLRLEVNGRGPGERVVLAGASLPVRAELRGGPLDRLAVLGAGGRLLGEAGGPVWEGAPDLEQGWVVAVAWNEDGGDWAVTGPVWLLAP